MNSQAEVIHDFENKIFIQDLFIFSQAYVHDSVFKFDLNINIQNARLYDFIRWSNKFKNDHMYCFQIWQGATSLVSGFEKVKGNTPRQNILLSERRVKFADKYKEHALKNLKRFM